MTKAPQAFRTISEVSETLDVPQHVLRFWEGKFPNVKPLKRAGGRRYYRPEDIDLLRGVRTLLYAEGYTIKGVQKVLRESGARYVSEIGRYGLKRIAHGSDSGGAPIAGGETDVRDLQGGGLNGSEDGADDEMPVDEGLDERLAERRGKLEDALKELLSLRDMLRAVRPKKADAA